MRINFEGHGITLPNIVQNETPHQYLNRLKTGGELDFQKLLAGIELPGLKHEYPGENHVFQHSFTGQTPRPESIFKVWASYY